MIVEVLVVGERLVVDQLHVPSQERVGHVSLRGKDSTQLQQAALQVEDFAKSLGSLVAPDDPVLQVVDPLAQLIEEREVAVDDRVEDGVQQASGGPSHRVRPLLEAMHHVLDHGGAPPMDAHHIASAREEMDLTELRTAAPSCHLAGGGPAVRLRVRDDLVGHQDVLTRIAVDLGSLVAKVEVLLRERVNLELLAQQLELDGSGIGDVEPDQPPLRAADLVDAIELVLPQLPSRSIRVAYHRDDRGDPGRCLFHRAGVYSRLVAYNVLCCSSEFCSRPTRPAQRWRRHMGWLPTPVEELLNVALVGELTVVRPDGRAITHPLIPLYDGERILMHSSTLFSRKLEHIKANPKVAVSLSDDVAMKGNLDRATIQGTARVIEDDPHAQWERLILDLWRRKEPAIDQFLKARVALPLFFERAVIEITPQRCLYWPGGNTAREPQVSSAPARAAA